MKIEEHSIFGDYQNPENRVTVAFLQICKIGGEDLIRYIANYLKIQMPSSDISIISQSKEHKGKSIPDGLLESNFSFKLFIESKTNKKKIDKDQLKNHKKLIKESTDILLYLTPHVENPGLGDDTQWASWETVKNIFVDYLQYSQPENLQLLEFLIEHFITLLTNLKILGSKWGPISKEEEMRVLVLAGSIAEGVAIKHNYYICQNKRNFKPSGYIAFYNNNQIRNR